MLHLVLVLFIFNYVPRAFTPHCSNLGFREMSRELQNEISNQSNIGNNHDPDTGIREPIG